MLLNTLILRSTKRPSPSGAERSRGEPFPKQLQLVKVAKIHQMPDILLIGNPSASSQEIKETQLQLQPIAQTSGGSMLFEQLDRIGMVSLQDGRFSKILSGKLEPKLYHHSSLCLGQFYKSLALNGKEIYSLYTHHVGVLELCEPVLKETSALLQLQEATSSQYVPCRTERSLSSDLVMNGFINISILEKVSVPDTVLSEWIGMWAGIKQDEQENVLKALSGKVLLISLSCQKPNYSAGSGAKLSFGKKKTAAPGITIPVNTLLTIGKSCRKKGSSEKRVCLDCICNGR